MASSVLFISECQVFDTAMPLTGVAVRAVGHDTINKCSGFDLCKGEGTCAWYSASSWIVITSEALEVRHVFSRDLTVLPANPHVQSAIGMNLPLTSQLQLVLIYWPRRDGRPSWPGWLV